MPRKTVVERLEEECAEELNRELEALRTVIEAIETVEKDAQWRILHYLAARAHFDLRRD